VQQSSLAHPSGEISGLDGQESLQNERGFPTRTSQIRKIVPPFLGRHKRDLLEDTGRRRLLGNEPKLQNPGAELFPEIEDAWRRLAGLK
jgi:hypothetical protein